MWRKAVFAAKKLGLSKLMIYNVGGGAFAGYLFDRFVTDVFEPAFQPYWEECRCSNIEVLGYNRRTRKFDGGFVPDVFRRDKDIDRTLYVNAWDPWSMIGNGNARDNSLDGWYGR